MHTLYPVDVADSTGKRVKAWRVVYQHWEHDECTIAHYNRWPDAVRVVNILNGGNPNSMSEINELWRMRVGGEGN